MQTVADKKRSPKPTPRTPAPRSVAGGWPARLKRLRVVVGERERGRKLTQVEAAQRANLSSAAWVAWETGARQPGRMALLLLSQAFPNEFPKTI